MDATRDIIPPLPEHGHRSAWVIAAVLLALFIAGLVAVNHFATSETERDLRGWQTRLGLVTDIQKAAVDGWVAQQYATLKGLADNTSLQLYMTELSLQKDDTATATDEPAEASYLRNLLIATAERDGFGNPPTLAAEVSANIERRSNAGIALLDMEKHLVAATPTMPALDATMDALLGRAERGKAIAEGPYANANTVPVMLFLSPVYQLQSDYLPEQQIGWVMGVKDVRGSLYPLLLSRGEGEKTLESVLVRQAGDTVEYISPLRDSARPLFHALDINTPKLADAAMLKSPGTFAELRDYADQRVLVTGRQIEGTSWVLTRKVERSEAMAESDARTRWFIAVYVLVAGVISVGLVALWQHLGERRAKEAAVKYQNLAESYLSQERLLKLVTDSQPEAVFIVDAQHHYRFANRVAAERGGMTGDDIVGKSLASVLGADRAHHYMKINTEATAGGKTRTMIQRVEEGEQVSIIKSEHIPLTKIPLPFSNDIIPGVLVVEQDITDAITEKERRERILKHLVDTLVTVVDRRDPYAGHHSDRVARTARAIAEEMQLDAAMIETAETAGRLMNIGKIMIKPDTLTKTGKLTQKDFDEIRGSIQASADMLDGVEFDGPVVETLRQSQESWDGTGPNGLRGKEILATARVIAVANNFVAMVSPRAYRAGMPVDDAVRSLNEGAGKRFDLAAVAALTSYIENHGGRKEWEALLKAS